MPEFATRLELDDNAIEVARRRVQYCDDQPYALADSYFPVNRAGAVGDTGPSDPEHWVSSIRSPDALVVLSAFADDATELKSVSADLRARAGEGGGATELDHFDARLLPGDAAHFG